MVTGTNSLSNSQNHSYINYDKLCAGTIAGMILGGFLGLLVGFAILVAKGPLFTSVFKARVHQFLYCGLYGMGGTGALCLSGSLIEDFVKQVKIHLKQREILEKTTLNQANFNGDKRNF